MRLLLSCWDFTVPVPAPTGLIAWICAFVAMSVCEPASRAVVGKFASHRTTPHWQFELAPADVAAMERVCRVGRSIDPPLIGLPGCVQCWSCRSELLHIHTVFVVTHIHTVFAVTHTYSERSCGRCASGQALSILPSTVSQAGCTVAGLSARLRPRDQAALSQGYGHVERALPVATPLELEQCMYHRFHVEHGPFGIS